MERQHGNCIYLTLLRNIFISLGTTLGITYQPNNPSICFIAHCLISFKYLLYQILMMLFL